MPKVKAVYDYASPHEDDLSFRTGQIITVTEEEGDDWYVGEYVDDAGTKHDGLFPRNFVEKYEPAPPPRPNRASRYKPDPPAVAPPALDARQQDPPAPDTPQREPEPLQPDERAAPKPQPPPLQVPPPAKPEPSPMSPMSPPSASSVVLPAASQAPSQAPKPAPPAPAGKKPPPIAVKSNAFRDRIAAFNSPAAAPVQPFKPANTTFIKKPFVPPPPSRNAYVPPVREAPPVKTYRREEDPEIQERQEQNQEAAEKAGLVAHDAPKQEGGEEDSQPKLSLKERIALLQKQQQEQAQRAASPVVKEKPKKPPVKKRTESFEAVQAEDSEDTELEKVTSAGSKASADHARPPRVPHDIKPPESHAPHQDMLSDANDADQSGADNTEDAEATSTSVEEDEQQAKRAQPPPPLRAPAAPLKEADVGDEQDVTEEKPGEQEAEEEEDEMDAETRRKLELRERMAKMSRGMGMPGMFGGVPMGGVPPPPKKKKPTLEKKAEEADEHAVPQQRVPMFTMPVIPTVKSPEQENRQLAVGKEDDVSHAITDSRPADDVVDVEDVVSQPLQETPVGERPPPIPTDRRPAPPPIPTSDRPTSSPAPPSVRPAPPPPPRLTSPGPGSESGDEMTDNAANIMSPRSPSAPFAPPSKRLSYFGSDDQAQSSPERRVPPMSLASPTSPLAFRPPPPPPPTAAPPSRHGDVPTKKFDREGETDYEGDYDTDMASGAPHKDALKSHAREASLDGNVQVDESQSARSPTIPFSPTVFPPIVPRAGPPPPPPSFAPGRPLADVPRAAPPPPPGPPPPRNEPDENNEDYDPYRYIAPPTNAVPAVLTGVPPRPQSQPPPPQTRPPPPLPPSMPPMPRPQPTESSEDDSPYSAPPPRMSHERAPPPPPPAHPHQWAPPPATPQERAGPPLPPQQERVGPPLPPQMERVGPSLPPQMERAGPPPPPQQERAGPPLPPQERPGPPPPTESQIWRPPVARKSLDVTRTLISRASSDQVRPLTNQDFIASDVDLGASSQWWSQPRVLPPSIQNRKDVLVDMDGSQSEGIVEKIVSVLYMDYSQTIISARFHETNPSDVQLEQRHEPPPSQQRPDQLENAYEQFGRKIAKDVESKQNTVFGNGTPHGLIDELLKPYQDALSPVSTRSFGALVYANLANAATQSYDEIRPGDIISFRNAKFQGKAGPMHGKYAVDVGKPDHVGVVIEWDGSKKKVRVWEQGREHKKVKPESFKIGDLRSGEVRVWRVMSRSWVGWK
ncbi:hypothetical protein P153DRAFT_122375 [Dothidotthia symphoricarpi CBS 119687]|uniref:SH3 domain-containing protein n=1 Tax=Dothidotthia symphoricarpi CBS 119687 TaxID=1392245 RepID=A0A6A6A1Z4_9PLEO|nr:uncharacterized protein P153DRAFT_122375 [Dothidotthia symphoricarpi CBS 119687]KAF2125193.1 hypothetical protein P153DRAFT_122375 [Dothidotthia symphoricarpi CBS 119687]